LALVVLWPMGILTLLVIVGWTSWILFAALSVWVGRVVGGS
jgi:hypothetical protein